MDSDRIVMGSRPPENLFKKENGYPADIFPEAAEPSYLSTIIFATSFAVPNTAGLLLLWIYQGFAIPG